MNEEKYILGIYFLSVYFGYVISGHLYILFSWEAKRETHGAFSFCVSPRYPLWLQSWQPGLPSGLLMWVLSAWVSIAASQKVHYHEAHGWGGAQDEMGAVGSMMQVFQATPLPLAKSLPLLSTFYWTFAYIKHETDHLICFWLAFDMLKLIIIWHRKEWYRQRKNVKTFSDYKSSVSTK